MNMIKHWAMVLVVFSFGGISLAEQTNAPFQLVVDLIDGSCIIGIPVIKSIQVRTSYAQMDIPLEQIHSIESEDDHKKASFELQNGDRLKGDFELEQLEVVTLFGRISIAWKHMTRIAVLKASEKGAGARAATKEAGNVEERMKQTVIPELDFSAAHIRDVVAFFQDASVSYSAKGGPVGSKGVNMVVLNLGQAEAPLITFTARHITLFEALSIVVKVANLEYRIDGNVVLIGPKGGRGD